MKCYQCETEMVSKIWVNQNGEQVGKPFYQCPKCGAKL